MFEINGWDEEVGASAKRVARPEGPKRATPRGPRGCEASDAVIF